MTMIFVAIISFFVSIALISAETADGVENIETYKLYGESCSEELQCKFENGLDCSENKNICECRKTMLPSAGFEIMEFDSGRGKCLAKLDSYCVYKKPNKDNDAGYDRVQMDCAEDALCDISTEKCVCGHKYYKSGGKCILAKSHGESCSHDKHSCSKYENLICDKGICKCGNSTKSNAHGHHAASKLMYSEEKGKCVKRVGDKCTDGNIECTSHSKCTAEKGCRCDIGFDEKNGTCHLTKSFGDSCHGKDCSTSRGLMCDDGKCACRSSHWVFDSVKGKCVRKIGVDCPSSAHCPTGSRCVKPSSVECPKGKSCFQTCKCDAQYYEKGGLCRLKKPYNESCDENGKECAATLFCIEGICQCAGHTQLEVQSGSCVIKVGEFCLFPLGSTDIILKCVQNASCHKGFCRCYKKFNETADGNCKLAQMIECDPENSIYSDEFSQCVGLSTKSCIDNKCVNGATCVDGICLCESNFFEDSESHLCHFKKIYNEKCEGSNQCLQNEYLNLECSFGVCNCKDDYEYSAVQKYVYSVLKEKTGHIFTIAGEFIGPRISMCVPRLGKSCKGFCQNNAVCNAQILTTNNTVEYTVCQCNKGYVSYSSGCLINSRPSG